MNRLDSEKQALLHRLSGESRIDGLEGAPYLGRFIRSIRAEVDRISHEASKLAPARRVEQSHSQRAAAARIHIHLLSQGRSG